jgi:protein-tyrosine kinase
MSQLSTIGDILVANGRLSQEDANRILERQRKDHLQFGEAALALKVLTKADIDFALSKQFDYSYLHEQDETVSRELVAAYKPFSRVGENLRALRSQLMLRWFNINPAHKVLSVVSAGDGTGRSFLAANLAIVFAQQGERTLLIDADMRAKPNRSQRALFKLGKSAGLSEILANRAGLENAQLIPGLPGLVVLPAGATPPNPQELLGRPSFSNLLRQACEKFDVVIIDTPSCVEFSDAEITAARAGAALLVTRKNQSLLPQANQLVRRLQESGVAIVGSVLNDA